MQVGTAIGRSNLVTNLRSHVFPYIIASIRLVRSGVVWRRLCCASRCCHRVNTFIALSFVEEAIVHTTGCSQAAIPIATPAGPPTTAVPPNPPKMSVRPTNLLAPIASIFSLRIRQMRIFKSILSTNPVDLLIAQVNGFEQECAYHRRLLVILSYRNDCELAIGLSTTSCRLN